MSKKDNNKTTQVKIEQEVNIDSSGDVKPEEVVKHTFGEITAAEARDTIATTLVFLTSAFTLVASLAWNNFITKLFDEFLFPGLKNAGQIIGMFLYAMTVTVIAVILINRLKKLQKRVGGTSVK